VTPQKKGGAPVRGPEPLGCGGPERRGRSREAPPSARSGECRASSIRTNPYFKCDAKSKRLIRPVRDRPHERARTSTRQDLIRLCPGRIDRSSANGRELGHDGGEGPVEKTKTSARCRGLLSGIYRLTFREECRFDLYRTRSAPVSACPSEAFDSVVPSLCDRHASRSDQRQPGVAVGFGPIIGTAARLRPIPSLYRRHHRAAQADAAQSVG
jgi:hypothetical protein